MALRPLHDLIAAHVLAAQRLHGDDTAVPVLAVIRRASLTPQNPVTSIGSRADRRQTTAPNNILEKEVRPGSVPIMGRS